MKRALDWKESTFLISPQQIQGVGTKKNLHKKQKPPERKKTLLFLPDESFRAELFFPIVPPRHKSTKSVRVSGSFYSLFIEEPQRWRIVYSNAEQPRMGGCKWTRGRSRGCSFITEWAVYSLNRVAIPSYLEVASSCLMQDVFRSRARTSSSKNAACFLPPMYYKRWIQGTWTS